MDDRACGGDDGQVVHHDLDRLGLAGAALAAHKHSLRHAAAKPKALRRADVLVRRLGDREDVGRQRAEACRAVAPEKALVVKRPRDLPVCVWMCFVRGMCSPLAG
jgi:hypothetical protein